MSFLSPWALGLAALVALPIALHLFRRETRRRLAFPAIRYLRRAVDRSARAVKLRDRLLLLTRAGLVLTLAAAAAGPLVGSGEAPDHAPTDLVLLIDNTGSMNRVEGEITLLDRQRERAYRLLEAARAADRFWVLPAVGPVLASGVQAEAAARAVAQIEATDAAANLGSVVREASRVLPPAAGRPREIVVMSDLQATALPGPPFELADDIRLVVSHTRADAGNEALLAPIVTPPAPGADGTVLARLSPPGAHPEAPEIRLILDGETASIARIDSTGAAILRLPNPGPGEHAVSLEIPPSGLRADDRRSFVLRTFAAPTIRHSGPPDSYVAQALATLEHAGRLRRGEAPGSLSAWVVEGVPPERATPEGRVALILIPPTDDGLLARFNAGLQRLGVPWTIELSAIPGDDELTAAADVPALASIRISGRRRLYSNGSGTDTVFVRTRAGSAWAVGGELQEGRYVLFGSPLVPDHTPLPVTAAMLPLLEVALVRWAGLGGALPAPVPAGTPTLLPPGADSVAPPGGPAARVDGGSPHVPLRSGIHTVFLSGGDSTLLAVNVPDEESDLTEADGGFARALGSAEAPVAGTDGEWSGLMYGSRRGAPVAPYLVVIALALLTLESVLAAPGRRAARVHRTAPGAISS